MSLVRVDLGERSYDIHIADGALASVGERVHALKTGRRCAVVTDSTVGPLYAKGVVDSLDAADSESNVFTIPAGEMSKSVMRLTALWDSFVGFGMDRSDVVVALGGGVVGDLAGFAAATYMRGIRYVQVPTTMLAMVDSSVGGKTAIDLDSGKNLIGAFHQPSCVVIDPSTLATLADRELKAGLAEVIKYGVIMDADLFERLEREIEELLALEPDFTAEVIRRCCELKAEVVTEDEKESGRRAILNFGHTAGHAIEAEAGFGGLLHGEAVAIGMVIACRLGERLEMIDASTTRRVTELLTRTGLPVGATKMNAEALMERMRHDKKTRAGRLNFVLPRRIGDVTVVKDVRPEDVMEVLRTAHAQ